MFLFHREVEKILISSFLLRFQPYLIAPLSMLPTRMMEYEAIMSSATVDRGPAIVILCEVDITVPVVNRMIQIVPSTDTQRVISVDIVDNQLQTFHDFAISRNEPLYLCVPFTNTGDVIAFLRHVHKHRSDDLRVYMPYIVFEQVHHEYFQQPESSSLMAFLNMTTSFVTTTLSMVQNRKKVRTKLIIGIPFIVNTIMTECVRGNQSCADSTKNYLARMR